MAYDYNDHVDWVRTNIGTSNWRELMLESDEGKAIKDIIEYSLDKQERELFAMVDNAINMKLEGKNISEWRETAKYLSDIAEKRLIEIERLNRPEPEIANITLDGKSIIDWRKDAAYFRDVYEEARELAENLQKEIDRLRKVVAEQGEKLNKQAHENISSMYEHNKQVRQLEKESRQLLAEDNRWRIEVAELNKKVDILHEAYREKLDRLHEAYHEKAMDLRELQANKEPADWSMSTFVEAVIQRKLTGMEKELLKASEALRATKEES